MPGLEEGDRIQRRAVLCPLGLPLGAVRSAGVPGQGGNDHRDQRQREAVHPLCGVSRVAVGLCRDWRLQPPRPQKGAHGLPKGVFDFISVKYYF